MITLAGSLTRPSRYSDLHLKVMSFALKMMGFVLEMMEFVLKLMI